MQPFWLSCFRVSFAESCSFLVKAWHSLQAWSHILSVCQSNLAARNFFRDPPPHSTAAAGTPDSSHTGGGGSSTGGDIDSSGPLGREQQRQGGEKGRGGVSAGGRSGAGEGWGGGGRGAGAPAARAAGSQQQKQQQPAGSSLPVPANADGRLAGVQPVPSPGWPIHNNAVNANVMQGGKNVVTPPPFRTNGESPKHAVQAL